MDFTDELWTAWAAGFLDGEGAVMLVYQRPKQYRRRGRVEQKPGQVILHVRVGNSAEAPLLRLSFMFGGTVKTLDMSMPARSKNRRQVYEWNLFGANAVEFLRKVRPYLMVKHLHADLAIEYHEKCFGVTGNLDERLGYYERMRTMQHKGQHLVKQVM